MQTNVIKTIEENHMLIEGDSVTVALSGGADSVALLLVLLKLKSNYNLKLSACHVNHNLRGDEAKRDENFCIRLCKKFDIPISIKSIDVKKYADENAVSTELAARKLRYKALNEVAFGKIATAHTLSDSLETCLFNLTRGTGLKGLAGIVPVRNNIIRPLINVTRTQIEQFLQDENQSFVNDSTNFDTDFSRNKIRNLIIPVLKKLNPSLEKSFKNSSEIFSKENEFLNNQGKIALYHSKNKNETIEIEKLLKFEDVIIKRAILLFLKSNDLSCDFKKLNLIFNKLKVGGAVTIDKKNTAVIKQGRLFIQKKSDNLYENKEVAVDLNVASTITLRDKKIEIIPIGLSETKLFVNLQQKPFKYCLDCDKIGSTVLIRTRYNGDKISLLGRGVTKTVKKLMNEAKMTPSERENAILFESNGEVVFLEGFGVCENAAVTNETIHGVKINIVKQ